MIGVLARIAAQSFARVFPEPVIVEEVGPGRFVPPYPKPLTREPGFLYRAIQLRRSLIASWTEGCYAASDYDFMLLRRQVCVINSPESIRKVLVIHDENFARKGAMMRRALEPLLGDGLFISDGETWRRRRPLVADIVHRAHLPSFGRTMTDGAEAMLQEWRAKSGQELDLLEEMAQLTAGIIARAVFGARLGQQAVRDIVEGFGTYQKQVDSFNLSYFMGNPEGRSLLGDRALLDAAHRVRCVVQEVIQAHLRGEGDQSSVVSLLLCAMEAAGDASIDLDGLRNEAATIFMAGHETTATTLTWALYALAKAPWAAAALRSEVDTILGGRPATVDDLPKLTYTRSVVEETLRLYPPVPILPRQALHPMRVGEVDIQRDALVLICPWLLHRSPDLWVDPHAFKPERFLDGSRPTPFSFIPFSVGPRVCAGQHFGIAEAVICLATLMQGATLELLPGARATPVCRLSLRPRDPVVVTVYPR